MKSSKVHRLEIYARFLLFLIHPVPAGWLLPLSSSNIGYGSQVPGDAKLDDNLAFPCLGDRFQRTEPRPFAMYFWHATRFILISM